MRYVLAKKEDGYWVKVITKTDCTNPKGHHWEWCSKEESEKVRKQLPKLTCAVVKCIYCGRVNHSM
jgi:hypothetical protein